MTEPRDQADDPGAPAVTDPEATSPEAAEAAVAEAEHAVDAGERGSGAEPVEDDPAPAAAVDPEAEAVIEEASGAHDGAAADAIAEEAAQAPSAEDRVAELTEDLKRLGAEYTNYRRRITRERQAAVAGAKAAVVTELLPILDDLALARQHGDLEAGPLKPFADKLTSTLESLGLSPFGAPGDPFDPELHEAVQDVSSGEEKALGQVLRPGYRLDDRTIRTAMVVIDDPLTDEAPAE